MHTDLTDKVNRYSSFIEVLTNELSGNLDTDQGFVGYASSRMLQRFRKRLRSGDDSRLRVVALSDFVSTNALAFERGNAISLDEEQISNARIFIEKALWNYTTRYCGTVQCTLDLGHLLSLWRFGPGASRKTRSTHFVDKLHDRRWSCTTKALPLLRLLRRLNPGLCSLDASKDSVIYEEVVGSSLSTVPKNEDTHRTICTEPLGNMILQLAAGSYIEGALAMVGIDISNQQPKNKWLAWKGSLDGSLATIDLKSASDLITPELVRLLWPMEWFELFSTIRSDYTLIDGKKHKLHMMSTMGNGFTFPMMTLTLLALMYASQPSRRLDLRRWAVFGDDIICPSHHYQQVVDVLTRAGLSVNLDKSYHYGGFRESCGGDYYYGLDVTPAYVKSLDTDYEVFIAINTLLAWVGRTKIPLPDTIRLLLTFVKKPLYVPEWSDPGSGILRTSVPTRYYQLAPVKKYRRRRSENSTLFLLSILYGTVLSTKGEQTMLYSPRRTSDKVTYLVEKCRLPNGWRTGRDPKVRSHDESTYIDCFLESL